MTSKTASRATGIFIAIGILFILIGIGERVQRSIAGIVSTIQPTRASVNYGHKLCENAFSTVIDNGGRDDLTHVSIPLAEGCWSGWVRLPRWWKVWHYELQGDGAWVAAWPEGLNPTIVFRPNQQIIFCQYCSPVYRLQGKGTLIAYTNASNGPAGTSERTSNQPEHETSSPPGAAQQRNGYLFTMGACKMAADAVSCTVSIENKKEQRNFIVNNGSRLVAAGHAKKVKRMAFGSTTMVDCCWVETVMPPDVPFELSLEFEGVSTEAKTCLLELIGGSVVQGNFDVTFYGVPVIK